MTQPESLTDYLNRRKPKVVELRRRPEWIRRMQQQGLPPKDYTRGPKDAA